MLLKIEVHHYFHHQLEVSEAMDILRRLDQRTAAMNEQITQIEQKVAELTTVTESAVTLLDEVAQLIRDNIGSPERLEQILADLEARRQQIGDAVARNTDVDPTPPGGEPPQG